jgi:hypothetical protein
MQSSGSTQTSSFRVFNLLNVGQYFKSCLKIVWIKNVKKDIVRIMKQTGKIKNIDKSLSISSYPKKCFNNHKELKNE